eukprot:195754_1
MSATFRLANMKKRWLRHISETPGTDAPESVYDYWEKKLMTAENFSQLHSRIRAIQRKIIDEQKVKNSQSNVAVPVLLFLKYDEKRIFNISYRSYKKNVKVWCTTQARIYEFKTSWFDAQCTNSIPFSMEIKLKTPTNCKFMRCSVNKTLPMILGNFQAEKSPFIIDYNSKKVDEDTKVERNVSAWCQLLFALYFLKDTLANYISFEDIDTIKFGLKGNDYFKKFTEWSEHCFKYSSKTTIHGAGPDQKHFETAMRCYDEFATCGYIRREIEILAEHQVFAVHLTSLIYRFFSPGHPFNWNAI